MRIQLNIERMDTGEKFALEARSPDFRAWERKTGKSWLTEDTSITNICEVAYYAAMRERKFLGTEEEWDLVADVDEGADGTEFADPTQPEVGDGPS